MLKKLSLMILITAICLLPVFSFANDETKENGQGISNEEAKDDANDIERAAPCKVTGVKIKCSKKNNITISWGKADNADGYIVYRWNKSKGEYILVSETKELKCTDNNRKSYSKYSYIVCAYIDYENESGETIRITGDKSDKVSIKTNVILKKVQNVKATGTDWNKVKITWDKTPQATGYKIYRWNSAKDKYVLIGKTKKTKFVKSGLNPNTKYTFKVAAYKVYKKSNGKKATKTGTKSKADKARTLKTVKGYKLGKPLKHMRIGSAYGYRGGAFHIGTDFSGSEGTAVYAATSGYVYRSRSNYGGLGNGIVIKNSKGITTWYGHLSKRLVSQGSYVKKGQKIGRVGHTGNAGSCNHLHFEVWINGSHYNPMCFY